MTSDKSSIRPGLAHEHELHHRRFGRNLGVGLALFGFVAIVFGLTIVKTKRGENMESYEHILPAQQDLSK